MRGGSSGEGVSMDGPRPSCHSNGDIELRWAVEDAMGVVCAHELRKRDSDWASCGSCFMSCVLAWDRFN
jgi:hypothetical protein